MFSAETRIRFWFAPWLRATGPSTGSTGPTSGPPRAWPITAP